jgi:preprotein translocase subunit SecG
MRVFYNVLLAIGIVVAIAFAGLVFLTGKGDAMSGGSSSVRTTFKGKASFDDQISKVTFILGGAFMLIMLVLDYLGSHGAFN